MLTEEDIKQYKVKAKNDPIWFAETICQTKLWEKQREILLAVKDNREVAVSSCNASGKSYVASILVHWWLLTHENGVVVTTAPTGRQVREILWREIRKLADPRFYPAGAVTQTKIDLNPKWFAIGLSTDRPEAFQGIHSENLLVIVDEASGIPEIIYEAIDGLTYERLLLIGNPNSNEGRFYRAFKSTAIKTIRISAFDTPNIKQGKEVIKGLIQQKDIDKFKEQYGEDSDVWRVRVLGQFPLQATDCLIGVDVIEAAMQREVKVLAGWEKKMGVDVARFGGDRTVITIRQHSKITRKEVITKADTMAVVGKIWAIGKEEKIIPCNIFIDEIGVGAGVVDRLKEQGVDITAVNVANKAKDFEHYGNLRAELGFAVKEWLGTAQIPQDDEYYQCSNIKYKFNSSGKLMLERKEDMKARGLPSPDTFDSLALTFAESGEVSYGEASAPVYSDMDYLTGVPPTQPSTELPGTPGFEDLLNKLDKQGRL